MMNTMKKCVSFFACAAAALTLAPAAGAQVFNHLAIGAGAGTDRVSFELAAPLGKHVQVRAGFGTAFGIGVYSSDIDLQDFGIEIPETDYPGVSIDPASYKAPLNARLARNDARLLFNIYPSAKRGFHFTVGAYMGTPTLATLGVDASRLLAELEGSGIPQNEIDSRLSIDGKQVRFDDGMMNAGVGSALGFRPYVGLGFGRPVREDRRVTFSFDLGAIYQGRPEAWVEGKAGRISLIDEALWTDYPALESLSFWPTLNFHIFVKLF